MGNERRRGICALHAGFWRPRTQRRSAAATRGRPLVRPPPSYYNAQKTGPSLLLPPKTRPPWPAAGAVWLTVTPTR